MDIIQIKNISNQPVKTCIKNEFKEMAKKQKCKFLLQKGETDIIPQLWVDEKKLKRMESMGLIITQAQSVTVPVAGATKGTETKGRGPGPEKKDTRKKERK